jgi:hypothetical protein
MTLVGTLFGTFVYETIATDGDEDETTTCVLGSEETQDNGTKTGLDQLDGTDTDDGTKMNDEAGTVTKTVLGTETRTEVGTESGMFVYETITAEGEEGIVII